MRENKIKVMLLPHNTEENNNKNETVNECTFMCKTVKVQI